MVRVSSHAINSMKTLSKVVVEANYAVSIPYLFIIDIGILNEKEVAYG